VARNSHADCALTGYRPKEEGARIVRIAIKIVKEQGATSFEHKASDSRRIWYG
jgi:hypothetical protein